jgi:hypothetical protein
LSDPTTSGLIARLLDDEQPSVVYRVIKDVLGEKGSDERWIRGASSYLQPSA